MAELGDWVNDWMISLNDYTWSFHAISQDSPCYADELVENKLKPMEVHLNLTTYNEEFRNFQICL